MGKKIILSEEQYGKLVNFINEDNMVELQSDSDSRMLSIISTLKNTCLLKKYNYICKEIKTF